MTEISRAAIIDIGSNSIRLVVYGGPLRAPATLFNEKVMAGLGRGVGHTGELETSAMKVALKALARFRHLLDEMDVKDVRTVATAAVREARNGAQFIEKIEDIGLRVELLSGDAEAVAAGYGVISAIPDADGVVGDLGGGSLELVRVQGGEVKERDSFPLGVLRLPDICAAGPDALSRTVKAMLAAPGWAQRAAGLPFYLVGGSWRSLARLHIGQSGYPLPILNNYMLSSKAGARLVRMVGRVDAAVAKQHYAVSSARMPMLGDAAALLAVLTNTLKPSSLVVSAYGVREGLLYQGLGPDDRAMDPLIAATRAEGSRQGRFPEHGDLMDQWIAPLFGHDPPPDERLRHATCLLSDVGWLANPEYRAERGLDAALEGNWIGVDARGRAMMAAALYTSFGGDAPGPHLLSRLASPEDLQRARAWGLAIRLGQRLGGGTADPLTYATLRDEAGLVTLSLATAHKALAGDVVSRRLKQLATALGRKSKLEIV